MTTNGVEIGRETYYKDGRFIFTRYVPRRALGQKVIVEVEIDRSATFPEIGRLIGLLAAAAGLKEGQRRPRHMHRCRCGTTLSFRTCR